MRKYRVVFIDDGVIVYKYFDTYIEANELANNLPSYSKRIIQYYDGSSWITPKSYTINKKDALKAYLRDENESVFSSKELEVKKKRDSLKRVMNINDVYFHSLSLKDQNIIKRIFVELIKLWISKNMDVNRM